MIGKVARMMVGRSAAQRHGYSAGAGAIVGLLAPFAIRKTFSLLGKVGAKVSESRKRTVEPEYGSPLGVPRKGRHKR